MELYAWKPPYTFCIVSVLWISEVQSMKNYQKESSTPYHAAVYHRVFYVIQSQVLCKNPEHTLIKGLYFNTMKYVAQLVEIDDVSLSNVEALEK